MQKRKIKPEKLPRVFKLTVEYGAAMGWENISLNPGCTEQVIDEHWWFAINPHNEANRCSHGAKVPAQSIYFEFNGWPAGYINAGGGMLAAGDLANEETLAAALDAAIRRTGRPRW
jgi:hypothetical protein